MLRLIRNLSLLACRLSSVPQVLPAVVRPSLPVSSSLVLASRGLLSAVASAPLSVRPGMLVRAASPLRATRLFATDSTDNKDGKDGGHSEPGPVPLAQGGTTDPEQALDDRADYLWQHGQFEEARGVFEELVKLRREKYGNNDVSLGVALNNLGQIYAYTDRMEDAEKCIKEAINIIASAIGPNAGELVPLLDNLAAVYEDMERYDDASKLYARALAIARAVHPPDSAPIGAALSQLGSVLRELGDLAQAQTHLQEAVRILEAAVQRSETEDTGIEHRTDLGEALMHLARVQYAQGDKSSAVETVGRAVETFKRVDDKGMAAEALSQLAMLYYDMGDEPRAEALLRDVIDLRGRALGEDSEEFGMSLLELGDFYLQAGRLEDCEKWVTRAATMLRKSHADSPVTAHALHSVGMLRVRQGRETEALPFLRKAYDMYVQHFGPDSEEAETVRELLASVKRTRESADGKRAARSAREAVEAAVRAARASAGKGTAATATKKAGK